MVNLYLLKNDSFAIALTSNLVSENNVNQQQSMTERTR